MIYMTEINIEGNHLRLASSEKGVCYLNNHSDDAMMKVLERFNDKDYVTGEQADLQHAQYHQDLADYFNGQLKNFDWPFDLRGTEFQQAVWTALLMVPYGRTKTYSDIAAVINRPKAVRAVGGAVGSNPVMIAVPCHRIIGKNGRLTGFSSGLAVKKQLLDIEDIDYQDE